MHAGSPVGATAPHSRLDMKATWDLQSGNMP